MVGGRGRLDPIGEGWEGNVAGEDFFIRWWVPDEWFCPFESFSNLKTTFCNIKQQLKSKLAWPVWTDCGVKIKMVEEQWLQLKEWSFYWVITWKLKFIEGGN